MRGAGHKPAIRCTANISAFFAQKIVAWLMQKPRVPMSSRKNKCKSGAFFGKFGRDNRKNGWLATKRWVAIRLQGLGVNM